MLRKQYGLSQIELAEKINLSFQQIQKYEKGITAISVVRLQQIADAFGVPARTFYDTGSGSGEVAEPAPLYDTGESGSDTAPFFTPEERILIKTFRKIKSKKIRQGVIQQVKGLVELEQKTGRQ